MTIHLNAFEDIHAMFDPREYFLTHEQTQQWHKLKPFEGLKILHNMPLYHNSLLKVEALVRSGAEVWTSVPNNIPANPEALKFIADMGLPIIPKPRRLEQTFDIILDCSGDYAELAQARLGTVELTATGTEVYRQRQNTRPVISVDDSRLKEFETSLGTGDGCFRALQHWLPGDFSTRHFVIFGFGKVGQGIAQHLKSHVAEIVIVDVDLNKIKFAQQQGFAAYHCTDPELIQIIRKSFAIITASGQERMISKQFPDKKIFAGVHLVNMGVLDEYGDLFSLDEVLFQKQGLNFSLEQPTSLRYIDPIFYAHNLGAELLLSGQFSPGYHAFPEALDRNVIERWQKFHSEIL